MQQKRLLVGVVDAVERGRVAQLRSYYDYRVLCGQSRLKSFRELNPDPTIEDKLSAVYDSVDVE